MLPVSVDAEDALEAGAGSGKWPVAVQQVVIVLQPVREHASRRTPSSGPPRPQPHACWAGSHEPPQGRGACRRASAGFQRVLGSGGQPGIADTRIAGARLPLTPA